MQNSQKMLELAFEFAPLHSTSNVGIFDFTPSLSLRLNYLVHELAPLGYHLANIALHALVTLLYHQVIISTILII